MPRTYRYVGPADIAKQAQADIVRLAPHSPRDVRDWELARGQSRLELTYVVDVAGDLVLSDRRSEHVACARGQRVLAAGELVLCLTPAAVAVEAVTNQSTGYCPEPGCWPSVHEALSRAGFAPPSAFTHAFEFRKCVNCDSINVLKPEMPECPTCDRELPQHWNFAD